MLIPLIGIVDYHIFYEGEESFYNLVVRLRDQNFEPGEPIPGVAYIKKGGDKELILGPSVPRIEDLDKIPSPYVMGYLDKFFDGRLTPLVETARGCPFKCNFCNAGESYFDKVHKFSDDYVRDELTYIAKKASQSNVGHVTFADNNFGMIPRDLNTTALLTELMETHGWPKSITVWTGKNSKKKVIDVTRELGSKLSISMSVQSMDPIVLKNVKRDNIKLGDYEAITRELNSQGRPQHAELIMPLPGETKASHIRGLRDLLDLNVSKVFSHTLQMLWGTPYKDDPDYRDAFGYVTKWRIVPLNFTRIDGTVLLDVEEVGVATSSLSFEDYVDCRVYLFFIDVLYNTKLFQALINYFNLFGIKTSDWVHYIFENQRLLDTDFLNIVESFREETVSELWDSEEDIHKFFESQDNFRLLENYDVGGNVLFKHRVLTLSGGVSAFIDSIFSLTETFLGVNQRRGFSERHLRDLKKFIKLMTHGSFDHIAAQEKLEGEFSFDVMNLVDAPPSPESFLGSIAEKKVRYKFEFDQEHLVIIEDGNRRYGQTLGGAVKLIQRNSGSLFLRRVFHQQDCAALVSATEITMDASVVANRLGVGPGECST